MDRRTKALFADRESPDREVAYQALESLWELTEEPVDWAYEVWDQLLSDLTHREGSTRAFSAQLLTRLAISDPEGRMLSDFPKVAAVMEDEKPVTARHTLQSLWHVGLAGLKQRVLVLEALETRFRTSGGTRRGSVVRRDVMTGLGQLFQATNDDQVKARAHALLDEESDEKERKKQRAAWKKAKGGSPDD